MSSGEVSTNNGNIKNSKVSFRSIIQGLFRGIVMFIISIIVFLILFNTKQLLDIFIQFYSKASLQQILALSVSGVLAGIFGIRKIYLSK